MVHCLPFFGRSLLTGVLVSSTLLAARPARAQVGLAAFSPAANAKAVAPTTPVTATFTQLLTSTSARALQVYSTQRGGLRTRGAALASVSGPTLTFSPVATPFLPGETITSIVTPVAASSGGHLPTGKVWQFTTATAGTGRGTFTAPATNADIAASFAADDLAAGDVDGDGDLDLLTANESAASVTLRLNGGDATGSNTGQFSNGADIVTDGKPYNVVLGDIDGDGDLDILTANFGYNPLTGHNSVSVRLNGGDATGSNTGRFSNGSTVAMGQYPAGLILGDVDGDGDLDLLTTASTGNGALVQAGPVQLRLNGGDRTGSNTGVFSNGGALAATTSQSAALGDVDGDGDLDLVLAAINNKTVSIRLNGGDAAGSNTGTFSNGSTVTMGHYPASVALGDVDADGDLDIVSAGEFTAGSIDVRLNGGDATGSGTGIFSGGSEVAVGTVTTTFPTRVLLGDVDGDGDLDALTSNQSGKTMSVRLNGPALPLATQSMAPLTSSFTVAPTIASSNAPLSYTYTGPALRAETVVSVYALTGQCIYTQPTGVGSTGSLPHLGLSSGWYLVHLQTGTTKLVTRFYQP